MNPEELKALLEKATTNFTRIEAENAKLREKLEARDEKLNGLVADFDKLKEAVDNGNADVKNLLNLAETIDELQDEISDVKSDFKSPQAAFDTKELKAAQESIVMEAFGAFVKTKDNQGDIFEFAKNYTEDKMKALNITNPAEGGLAVAEVLARDVLDYYKHISPIVGEVGRKSSMTRNYRQLIISSYPSVAQGIENVAGVVPAETDTQEYKEVKSKEFKLYAQPRLTNEALYGTDIDVYSDLIEQLGEEIAIYLANQILYGNGADKNARGILSSNRLDITDGTGESWKPSVGAGARGANFFPAYATGVSGDLGTDDKSRVDFLLTFMRKLPARYRAGAKLFMNENTLGVFERLRDADERPVFRVSYMNGEPMLNGKPVVIDDTLPDIAPDSAFIMYGDLPRAFVINDGDIDQMLLDPYTVKGCLIVYTEKEMFEMIQRSDAILIGVATANGPA